MALNIESLNTQQKKAVETTEGPVLVLAGAGSGKTRVLTFRIAYLISSNLASPNEILAVTFTNKAANEMKERVSALSGGRIFMPWMGTFHSICVKILRQDGHHVGLDSRYSIYDSSDQLAVIKQAMDRLNISQKDVKPKAVHSYISSAKNELVEPNDYASYAQGYFQEIVASIYPEYQKILKENNAVDFDDLLMYVVNLFKKNPEVLKKYQETFKYILVDEYQDTNHAQYVIVNALAQEHKNICVVGDDDQSIYAFRGATIRNILNFEKDYPEAEVIKLEQNYRSTRHILDAAYEVVSKNKGRTDKKLWTDSSEGDLITLYTAKDEKDEADWVVSQIEKLSEQGVSVDEIAILYRTNAQSRALEESLVRHVVSYHIVGGTRFYERKEIKDILAYLRTIYNPKDDGSLIRIINTPRRGIGGKTLADLERLAQDRGLGMLQLLLSEEEEISHSGLREFGKLVRNLRSQSESLNVVELINYILEKTGYIKMLSDGDPQNEARIENLKELISVAEGHASEEPLVGLEAFLEEVSLMQDGDQENDSGVTLMTIHAAKGLEFEHVFVVGLEEGLFPHSRIFSDPKELEEERRLAYVAITRAKQNLYLLHASSRLYFGSKQNNPISRFIEDIPIGLIQKEGDDGYEWVDDTGDEWDVDFVPLELKVGDKVKHEYFGIGTVQNVNEAIIKVRFGPVYGVKELARDLAPLELA